MFRKTIILFVFLAVVTNYTAFSQTVSINAAIANAAREIAESVPGGTKIAVLNISSDYPGLSDYIINELIASLVSTRAFQVVPRSTVELELARSEFSFQITGYVSEDSQKEFGRFLGAETIITGTVAMDSTNSYHLTINAIHLESFTYQASYRVSVQNSSQIQTLIAGSGAVFYEDYSIGERFGMGALNMVFGLGSIMNRQYLGFVTTGVEVIGVGLLVAGLVLDPEQARQKELNFWNASSDSEFQIRMGQNKYDATQKEKDSLIFAGAAVIGASVLFGYIIPFFHHRPNPTVAAANFPLNFDLVSNNGDLGFRISYTMRF